MSQEIVKPKALKAGSVVGIVAPSSPPFEEGDLEFTYNWLTKLGLRWKLGKHVLARRGDLAGTDAQRLEDFHAMWSDPEVEAILPVRGGNGSVRLLPQLDFNLFAQKPKILIGYSDITGLLIPIHQRTGLVTFHGPTAGSFFESPYTHRNFVKAVMTPKPIGTISDPVPKEVWNPEYPPTRLSLVDGQASGRLTGGCMTLIRQLMGTAYEIDTRDKILFIEDIEEEPHTIDRMLTQLELAGKLATACGIIIGELVRCRPGSSKRNSLSHNMSAEQMLRERFKNYNIPVIYGLRLGHSKEKCTLPLGVMASIKAEGNSITLKLEESATSE